MAFESRSITGSLFGTASWAISASAVVQGNLFPASGSNYLNGSITMNTQPIRGNEIIYGTVGNAPIGAGVDLNMGISLQTSPNIAYNFADYSYTLKSGSTYFATAEIMSTWGVSSPNAWFQYQFVSTSNTPVGTRYTTGFYQVAGTSGQTAFSGSAATAFIQPTTDIRVKLRVVSGSGTCNIGLGQLIFKLQRVG